MDTIHKYWPALKKDKKFLDKFKKFHELKSVWGHGEPNHEWPKHVQDLQSNQDVHPQWSKHQEDDQGNQGEFFQAQGSHPTAAIAALPEPPEVNLPGLHHLSMPDLPNLDQTPIYDSYGKRLDSNDKAPENQDSA